MPLDANPLVHLASLPWTIRHDSLLKELKTIIEQAFRGPGDHKRAFLPEGKAGEILREERGKTIVKKLYNNLQSYWRSKERRSPWRVGRRRTVKNDGGPDAGPERFWECLLGRDVEKSQEQDMRAKLFVILILISLELKSAVWPRFIKMTQESYNDKGQRFCDALLRFQDLEEVGLWFGTDKESEGSIGQIFSYQNKVCPHFIVSGTDDDAPTGAIEPCIGEWERKIDREGTCCYEVDLDLRSCDGIPQGRILRKDMFNDKAIQAARSAYWSLRVPRENPYLHIPEVYAIVKYRDKTSIYMKLASCSLYEYLSKKYHPTNVDDQISFFGKLLHLAATLVELHERFQMRHGDVQTKNTLVQVEADGNLVFLISDFSKSSIDKGEGLGLVQRTDQLEHCSPEDLQGLASAETSFKSDVWGLACLCCLVLVWIEGGPSGLERFREERWSSAHKQLELSGNYWFFNAEPDQAQSREGKRLLQVSSETGRPNYHVFKKTQNREEPMVITVRQVVLNYFERICYPQIQDEDRGRQKVFITDAFKTILESALVPDPTARCSMREFHSKLQELISRHSLRW